LQYSGKLYQSSHNMEISELSHTVNRAASDCTPSSIPDDFNDRQVDSETANSLKRVALMNSILRCIYAETHDAGARALLGRNFEDPHAARWEKEDPVLPGPSNHTIILPPGDVIESDMGTLHDGDKLKYTLWHQRTQMSDEQERHQCSPISAEPMGECKYQNKDGKSPAGTLDDSSETDSKHFKSNEIDDQCSAEEAPPPYSQETDRYLKRNIDGPTYRDEFNVNSQYNVPIRSDLMSRVKGRLVSWCTRTGDRLRESARDTTTYRVSLWCINGWLCLTYLSGGSTV
jgi:hypothetical protein